MRQSFKGIIYFIAVAVWSLLIAAGLVACGRNDQPVRTTDAPPQSSTGQPPPVSAMGARDQGVGIMERIQQYRQRLDKDPKDLEALIFLGNANYDIQRFDKAAEYYERALVLDPKNLQVRTDLATSDRNTGKVDQAVKELNQVLTLEPKHETALYNLGFVLLNDKKDVKGALKAWETLVSKDPTDPKYDAIREKIEELKKVSPRAG
jgi:cytochrome c-type biogenesis protein CcmH/NrfG